MKKTTPKNVQVEYWVEKYFQAKTDGDQKKMKMYADLIRKLGGKVPKI
jgi:hypothetical protein